MKPFYCKTLHQMETIPNTRQMNDISRCMIRDSDSHVKTLHSPPLIGLLAPTFYSLQLVILDLGLLSVYPLLSVFVVC